MRMEHKIVTEVLISYQTSLWTVSFLKYYIIFYTMKEI